MADETRRPERTETGPERPGVREPQPPGLDSRREFDASDVARANESRTAGEPATAPGAPQEPRSAPAPGRGEDEGPNGVLDRARRAWHRLRSRD